MDTLSCRNEPAVRRAAGPHVSRRLLTGGSAGEGAFAGVGSIVTAFRTGLQGPYAVAGVGGGLGSPHSKSFSSVWGSWSAGAGYDLLPAPFLTFGAELRWREISLDNRGGLELAAGLGLRFGGSRRRGEPDKPATPARTVSYSRFRPRSTLRSRSRPRFRRSRSSPHGLRRAPSASAALADSVVETATRMMGRKYEYGGTGEEGDGFDCSGLIQYAYAQHGITLPAPQRRSGAAREGPSPKDPETPPGRRSAHLLEQRRAGDARRAVHRQRPVHPQRERPACRSVY